MLKKREKFLKDMSETCVKATPSEKYPKKYIFFARSSVVVVISYYIILHKDKKKERTNKKQLEKKNI